MTPTVTILDADVSLASYINQLLTDGIQAVARYYSDTKSVPFGRDEALAYTNAGIYCIAIREKGLPNNAAYFTGTQGAIDAQESAHIAHAVGQPGDTDIFTAVDWDDDQMQALADYMTEFRSGLATYGYHASVYGSAKVCEYLDGLGLTHRKWLAESKGWTGWEPEFLTSGGGFHIAQIEDTTWNGISVDTNTSWGDSGAWLAIK